MVLILILAKCLSQPLSHIPEAFGEFYLQFRLSGTSTSLCMCAYAHMHMYMCVRVGEAHLLSEGCQPRESHVTFSSSWQEGGVVALFKVCRQDSFRCLYPQALRTLASICCVEEGVHQLEKVWVTGWVG
jgi:hypothetical protein